MNLGFLHTSQASISHIHQSMYPLSLSSSSPLIIAPVSLPGRLHLSAPRLSSVSPSPRSASEGSLCPAHPSPRLQLLKGHREFWSSLTPLPRCSFTLLLPLFPPPPFSVSSPSLAIPLPSNLPFSSPPSPLNRREPTWPRLKLYYYYL